MTRVTEALRQAALVEEEFRLSSGRVPVGSPSVPPPSPPPSWPGLLDVAYAPEAAGGLDSLASTGGQRVTVPARTIAPPTRAAALGLFATPSVDRRLVVSPDASRAAVEQYRRVAAGLQEIQDRSAWAGSASLERTLKTVLVTSALPGEGKTLTVVNLALTLSEHYGRQALVIDADLRAPAVHDLLGLSNVVGLTDVLRSGIRHLPLQEVSSRLSVLSAGRAALDPDNLASDRMRSLLRDAASDFDWVFVDAPAVARSPDARLLAGLSRAVLFVIALSATPYAAVERAMFEIGRGSIIGAVLNQVPGRLVRRRRAN